MRHSLGPASRLRHILGGRHGISLHLDSLTLSTLPAAGRAASFSRVEVAVQNTPYRLDGSTKRPETLFFYFVKDTGWQLPQLLARGCGQPVTQCTLVSLGWDHLGRILGAGTFGGRWFLETGLSLGEWKRTQNGHFLLYTGELESGRVLRPRPHVVRFREGERCEAGV